MTEEEWLAAVEPQQMIMLMDKKEHSRKSRLVGCALWRFLWEHLSDAQRHGVEITEKYVDGLIGKAEWAVSQGGRPVHRGRQTALAIKELIPVVWGMEVDGTGTDQPKQYDRTFSRSVKRRYCEVIRCVFGNPFRPVVFLPEWRTTTVLALAQQMYESRDFSPMPILADALMDAGCADETILTHCRGPGPHVRGCHIVDACLAKS